MNLITPPFIVNRGIALYVPPLNSTQSGLVSLEITYSRKNPLFSFLSCDTSGARLSSTTQPFNPEGVIFIYESSQDLSAGFYTLSLELNYSSSKISGQRTVGFIRPTPRLIIGLPYSTYAPIALS